MTDFKELSKHLSGELYKANKRNKLLLTALSSVKRLIKKLHNLVCESRGEEGDEHWGAYQQKTFMKRINKALKND